MVLSPQDFVQCVYLCTNDLAPAYADIELGIGDSILMKAVQSSTGRSLASLRKDMATVGDLGEVAAESRGRQKTLGFGRSKAALTVVRVFDRLKAMALMSGNKSQQRKQDMIHSLLMACQCSSEAKFLIRSLGGKLRIGLAEQSVLAALGHAVAYTPPVVAGAEGAGAEASVRVLDASVGVNPEKFKALCDNSALRLRTVYFELPNYDHVLPLLLEVGLEELGRRCGITPGVPMKPMLAHPTKGIEEVLQRFDGKTFACEYKYDGERAQVHMVKGGSVHIFSRNSEDNTSKYPDVVARMCEAMSAEVQDCVLDCEAVAYDVERKQILPFQVLSTRKRKDADESEIKVQVCLFAFDLLYLNGKSYVRETFQTRRDALHQHFSHREGQFHFANSLITSDTDEIAEYLEQSIKDSCEGLMVKALDVDATYEIAKRSHSWLKLKKDYLDGVGDTLDLVVLGGWIGKGKRTGTYGAFLLACYDEEQEEFQAICKIGTGFSDEDLKAHAAFFKDHVMPAGPRNYYRYDPSLAPDHWFDSVQVWEVKAADLSISPRHKAAAGLVDREKGISLRFPRFMRIRDDKSPEMATTAQQVADMYNNQETVKNNNRAGAQRF
jgi:DNA ligase-1